MGIFFNDVKLLKQAASTFQEIRPKESYATDDVWFSIQQ
jgi:hypothetical protein